MRYRARVEYDGTDFAGFQVNPGKRTVQGVLEAALADLGDGGRAAGRRGRSDGRRVHASGQVIAFTYAGRRLAGTDRTGARCAPSTGRRGARCATGAGRFNPRSRRGTGSTATPSGTGREVLLRERTALAAGPARYRRDGAGRVGLHRPARLPSPRGGGAERRSGPSTGPGQAGGPAGDDRRPGRRLPARDGPANGGRPPGGRPRQYRRQRSGRRRLAPVRPRRDSGPGEGTVPEHVAIGRRPGEPNGAVGEREQGPRPSKPEID